MFAAKPAAEAAGFKFWKPLVWDKCAIGMGYHYRARYEFILFFEKGKRKLNNLSIPAPSCAHKRIHNGYPTQKPTELLEVLIEQSTQTVNAARPIHGLRPTGAAALNLTEVLLERILRIMSETASKA